ncbi:MAG: O-methyltransferase [Anaerolineales bacterium]|nr:O-methyltransferase [Anaerolineales bacterium]
MEELWGAVDDYFEGRLVPADPLLESALRAGEAAGMPAHHVARNQAKFLWILARLTGAKKILEIGTLAGYSAIWMARALPPGGLLITLEADPRHASVARANLAKAGLSGAAEVRVGRALDLLPQIDREGIGPFDLIFLDADKEHNPEYFAWSLRLSRRGSLIVADNVVRGGAVADPRCADPSVVGMRRFLELVGAEPRVDATAIQTVGVKGYDGFLIALVTAESDSPRGPEATGRKT